MMAWLLSILLSWCSGVPSPESARPLPPTKFPPETATPVEPIPGP